jgi:uncharacterized protein with PIN domain
VEKVCRRCLKSLPLASFNSRQGRCKECLSELGRANYRSGRSETRSYDGVYAANIMRTFGMTISDYNRMLDRQGGVCAVCNTAETVLRRNGEPYRLAVDHDHRTMQVRGLLCRRCNQVVWAIEEHEGLLRDVADYLARFRGGAEPTATTR